MNGDFGFGWKQLGIFTLICFLILIVGWLTGWK